MLRVQVEDLGSTVVLRCAGRMVRGFEGALLCPAIAHRGRSIAVDLSAVEAIDAAGVGALIALQAAGIYLRLVGPTAAVREVLLVTKMDTVFEIVEAAEMADMVGEADEADLRVKREMARSLAGLPRPQDSWAGPALLRISGGRELREVIGR